MKPTKKQIEEVKAEAILQNKSIEEALKYLELTSLSMYKSMGAKGVVNSVNYKSSFDEMSRKSLQNYRSGRSGMSSLTK